MKLTKAQQNDIELCLFFCPTQQKREPIEEEIIEFLALSERGEGKKEGKFSKNPIILGKTYRGLTMGMWEEGVLEGIVPYFTLLGGENQKEIPPRTVVDFMKKEMFKSRDAEVIENCYQEIIMKE